jgi:hypothetical protein
MSLLNPALIYGLALVAVPVVLHLLLKQKPKKLLFPALRLIQKRHLQNSRRFRLRHWWLLFLRMAVLGLIVFALTRPSLPAANYGLAPRELTTLLVLVGGAVATYLVLLKRRERQGANRSDFQYRRTLLRGWTTGATILLIALLVCWPYQRRVAAEITSPTPLTEIDLPVAAVFLFDASFSMNYQQDGKTRLDLARQIALDHLGDLPVGSKAAVADTASDNPLLFQSSLIAAKARIGDLKLDPVSLPLNQRLRTALTLQEDDRRRMLVELGNLPEKSKKDQFIRRIYVLTDLASHQWQTAAAKQLKADLERLAQVNVFLVDVGDPQPRNTAITNIQLSREKIPTGGNLLVRAVLEGVGEAASEVPLKLSIRDAQGKAAPRGAIKVNVEPGQPVVAEFPMVTGLTGSILHGEVILESSDPLLSDNTRYFTIQVGDPTPVLVVAPSENVAFEWLAALEPFDAKATEKNRFAVTYLPPEKLATTDLAQFETVYLINVVQPSDEAWTRLDRFVDGGGGLGVILGAADLKAEFYNRPKAQVFLPGELIASTSQGLSRLKLDRVHPMFWKFRQYEANNSFSIMEGEVGVYRFWKVEPAAGTGTFATHTNAEASPALIERVYGKGRTVMFTTGVNLPDSDRQRWNNLPSTLLAPWVFRAFADQMTEYLARVTEMTTNFTAGEDAILGIPAGPVDRQMFLRQPALLQTLLDVPAGATSVRVSQPHRIGQYDVIPRETPTPVAGFSLNVRPEESQLTRLTREQLDDLFGKDRVLVARTIEELKSDINTADLGKEVFPLILLLVVIFFCGEHLVANRFYENEVELAPA